MGIHVRLTVRVVCYNALLGWVGEMNVLNIYMGLGRSMCTIQGVVECSGRGK